MPPLSRNHVIVAIAPISNSRKGDLSRGIGRLQLAPLQVSSGSSGWRKLSSPKEGGAQSIFSSRSIAESPTTVSSRNSLRQTTSPSSGSAGYSSSDFTSADNSSSDSASPHDPIYDSISPFGEVHGWSTPPDRSVFEGRCSIHLESFDRCDCSLMETTFEQVKQQVEAGLEQKIALNNREIARLEQAFRNFAPDEEKYVQNIKKEINMIQEALRMRHQQLIQEVSSRCNLLKFDLNLKLAALNNEKSQLLQIHNELTEAQDFNLICEKIRFCQTSLPSKIDISRLHVNLPVRQFINEIGSVTIESFAADVSKYRSRVRSPISSAPSNSQGYLSSQSQKSRNSNPGVPSHMREKMVLNPRLWSFSSKHSNGHSVRSTPSNESHLGTLERQSPSK